MARCCDSHRWRGTALIEAVLALAILGLTASAILGSLMSARATERAVFAHEDRFLAAVHLLDAAMLWNRRELELRLGRRAQGEWTMEIQRVDETLFRLTVLEADADTRVLTTFVQRR